VAALKLLYVDDDDDIREVAELSLQMDADIDVRSASSGAKAIAMLAQRDWRPDALLLDVMMPEMDGPAVLAAIRAQAEFSEVPAIFITARVLPGDVERLRGLGAVGVIPKPFDPLRLAADVRELLGGA
jgi:two-component system OmpR family response regulator